jgi:GNAT superfamily N-acetyltransferase
MSDHWMPTITLPMSEEAYRQLPRHAAFRYEYLNGKAILSPETRHYHAILDLAPLEAAPDVAVRPLRANDWPALASLFAASFRYIQPFGSLDEATRRLAAEEALERTKSGGDGPWIERASFVAVDQGKLVGGILLTLLPLGDPCIWESYRWEEPPPLDCIERRQGRPHLTWIFVDPHLAGKGSGTALLAATIHELLALGYTQLLSTFVVGNHSSMLWHWRTGFRLLAYPGSRRLRKERTQKKQK